MENLVYNVKESREYPGHWHVEAINNEGAVYVAVFSGPDARARAIEYADWKNGTRAPGVVLEMVRRPA